MGQQTSQLPQNRPSLISTQATPLQYRAALIFSALLILAALVLFLFARIQGPAIPAFNAVFLTLILIADLITAYLLFGQFRHTGTPSLAILASAYLFASMIIIPYSLIFPGIFASHGLLNANRQTVGYMWSFWHSAFPLGIFLYVLVDRKYRSIILLSTRKYAFMIALTTITALLVLFLFVVAIKFSSSLPNITTTTINIGITSAPPTPLIAWLVNALTCFSVFFLMRGNTILQVWLRVTALAFWLEVTLVIYGGNYFSYGWYAARFSSMLASILLLCALLSEINRLYATLVSQHEELTKHYIMQNEFISVVGHEFRTALTSLEGFSEMLHTEDFSPEEVREFAGDMYTDTKRLNRLITDMLDLERMKSGRMQVQLESLDLNDLLEDIVQRAHATDLLHHIRLDLDPSLPPLSGDRDKLTQVVTNLLNNAIKYSPQSSDIVVKSWREGNTLRFSVQDYGIGIPSDQLEQVFERFTRVESSQTHYIGGTGLGLPIVRQIVEVHQGSVWAESTPGQGSTFYVSLPLQPVRALVTVASSSGNSASAH